MKKNKLLILLSIFALPLGGCDFLNSSNNKTEEEPIVPVGLIVEDNLKDSYKIGTIFKDHINVDGLKVYLNYSNDEKVLLTYENPKIYTVTLKNSQNEVKAINTPFNEYDTYTVYIKAYDYEENYSFTINTSESSIMTETNLVSSCFPTTEQTDDTIVVADSEGNDILFSCNYVFSGDKGIQLKKNTGKLFNKEPYLIRNIKLVKSSGYSFSGHLCWGNEINPNANVESVASGKTYNNPGNYKYFRLKAGSSTGYLNKIVITIEITDPKEVQKINLSNSSIEMDDGTTATLTYGLEPTNANIHKKISWESSNENIVTVDSGGKLTAKSPGNAVVTVSNASGITSTCSVTVKLVHVESVSLDFSTITIETMKTKQLTPTIFPSNATIKDVTFSSSDTSVATVSNTGLVKGIAIGVAIITVRTLEYMRTATCTVNVTNYSNDDWTILIYMCGSDLESESGCATMDLEEIDSVAGQPAGVNIVVEAGGAKSWNSEYSSVINKSNLNRFHLDRITGTYKKDEQISQNSMGDSTTLQSFLEWGITTYPADKIGLIFWNHGGGLGGVCYDENYHDESLKNDEVYDAIINARENTGYSNKFEFIGYDACLMSIQDTASLNAEYAKYMVASQESEWGYGWSYDQWIKNLYRKESTESIVKAIVDSFYNETYYSYTYFGMDNDQTLAYYNLQNFSNYAAAVENFAINLSTSIIGGNASASKFKEVINKARKYGCCYDGTSDTNWTLQYNQGYLYDIFDIGDFIHYFKTDSNFTNNMIVQTVFSELERQFNNLQIYEKHGSAANGSTGLCLFFPISGYTAKYEYSETMTKLPKWRQLCIDYGNWYF